MQMKKISKVKVLSLILTLVMLITLNTRAIFASERTGEKLNSVTLINTRNGSKSACYAGDTLKPQLNSTTENYTIEWYYTMRTSTGALVDVEIKGQNGTTLTMNSSMKGMWYFCKMTNKDDPSNVVESNKICMLVEGNIPVEEYSVGQVLPAKQNFSVGSLVGIGYDYCCFFDYEMSKYEFYKSNSGVVIFYSSESIVTNIETYPSENGGWQGNEVDVLTGEPLKGKSVYKIDFAAYVPYDVTHSLDKITATSDTAGEKKAVNKFDYKTTLTPAKGYNLPKEITVNIGGNPAIVDTDYTYNSKTGEVVVKGDKITGDIKIIANGHVHTYGEWVKEDDVNHIRTCSCGEVESANHNWNDGEITTKPTTLAEGVKTFTCTDCHATKTEAVAKLPTEVPSTEKPAEVPSTQKPENHVVQTEDYSNIILWGTLLVIASGVVVVLKRNKLSK